jgi:hypothetical protein
MTRCVAIIEAWNVETFDSELLGDPGAHNDVTTKSPRIA